MQQWPLAEPAPEPETTPGAAEQLEGCRSETAAVARAVICPSRFASPGTALDAELYCQLLDDVDADQHKPVHLMPGSGMHPQERPPARSPLTLHIETLQPDNLLDRPDESDGCLHAWMVNPEVGYPGCLPDAALSRIDVVLCKTRAAVGVMQAYKAQHSEVARYRILHTGHTSKDLRPAGSAMSSELPGVVFYSPKTGRHMYLINPAIERDDADGGALVVIYRLTAVDVAAETSYQRRRYMTENATNLAVLHTSEVDGLDEHLESYPDPTRCSCLLRWRPAAGSIIGQDKVTSVGEFELLQPFTPLPEPDDWLTTSRIMYGFEDPRLFRFRGKLWVICGFLGSGLSCLPWTTPGGTALKDELRKYRHHLVLFPLDAVSAKEHERSVVLLHYEGRRQVEKNWMPFEHRGQLFVVYSVSPHVILCVDIKTGLCTEAHATHPSVEYDVLEQGEPGNGAPPVRVTLSSGEALMIGAAHIRRIPKGRAVESVGRRTVRKTFFYAFEAAPPFRILSVGPLRTLLLSRQQQQEQQRTTAVSEVPSTLADPLIEFLSGMCVDQVGQNMLLAFGVDDTFACAQIWPLAMILSDLGLQQDTCKLPSQMAYISDRAGMDYSRAIHIGGKSKMKNTEAVLRCWTSSCCPNRVFPPLTVVAWGPLLERLRRCFPEWPWPQADDKQEVILPNVTILTEKLPQAELQRHMAGCGVHVCPSACEGFGHVINEARSLGAVIVTTAAPPMDELVTDGVDGFTVPVTDCTAVPSNVLGAHMYEIQGKDDPSVSGLVTVMSKVLALGEDGCRKMGMQARLRFERERREFEDALRVFGKATMKHGRAVLSMSDACVPFEPDKLVHLSDERHSYADEQSADQATWVDYLRKQHVHQNLQGNKSDEDCDELPTRLLEVEPDHCVLDLCAGANAGQSCCDLLRKMHSRGIINRNKQTEDDLVGHDSEVQKCDTYIPTGVYIANDLDLRRLSAVIDQARKQLPLLCAPLLVTRCDAATFPTLQCVAKFEEPDFATTSKGPQPDRQAPRQYKQKFDRVLCCPPSSSNSIPAALAVHGKQLAILRRGLELLNPGGVLVYSVRTLDPVQCEAVVVAASRSLRALPEWGQYGIEFIPVHAKLARDTDVAGANTTAGTGTCAAAFGEQVAERGGATVRVAFKCQPALDNWSVPHPNYAGLPSATTSADPKCDSEHVDHLALAEGDRLLYRSFDDVPKDLRNSAIGSGSHPSSSLMAASAIKSTAFPPNYFGCSKDDAELLGEIQRHCMRVGDRFIAILRKRTYQEVQKIEALASSNATGSTTADSCSSGTSDNSSSCSIDGYVDAKGGDCSDTMTGDVFDTGAEVEVITPQGQRWPAVVKGRGKTKKYKGLLQVVFPDGCSFHCDPAQLVHRQQQPSVKHSVQLPSGQHELSESTRSCQQSRGQVRLEKKTRRERVVARRPGLQMFDQVDITGAQSIWRELCHTYGFNPKDKEEDEKTKDCRVRRQQFPGDALCIARYQKGKGTLYLLSQTIVDLRFRTNCRVVTAGIPCFSRVTTEVNRSVAHTNVHDCALSRSVTIWHWRPCHEAVGLVARCCADGAAGVLRLSVPRFTELLLQRLLPRSALHEVGRDTAITLRSEKDAEEGAGDSLGVVGLPATGSVVVIPSAQLDNSHGDNPLMLPPTMPGAYDGTTAAGMETVAVVGDLTATRLTISTGAEARAYFAQILRQH